VIKKKGIKNKFRLEIAGSYEEEKMKFAYKDILLIFYKYLINDY